ncbi:MAG: hypothetical protein K0R00_191 [Herbinix sp.]|jgi:hypothetical protein|nr:hypothetical protein [Herbinix sp.]
MFLLKLKLIIALLKGGDIMAIIDVYVTLIMNKRRTIEQVPAHLRTAVLADLTAMGLDGNGDPLQQQ